MLNSTDKIIKHKVELLNLAEEWGNVSKACRMIGAVTRYILCYEAVEQGGVEVLLDKDKRQPK